MREEPPLSFSFFFRLDGEVLGERVSLKVASVCGFWEVIEWLAFVLRPLFVLY